MSQQQQQGRRYLISPPRLAQNNRRASHPLSYAIPSRAAQVASSPPHSPPSEPAALDYWIAVMAPAVSAGTEDDDVREHLLNIPEPEHLKREFSSKDSLKRRSGAKISIVNLERFSDSGVPLLSGVTMNVQSGQVVGIIGPSGSGKSTLLRSLNRLWEPPVDSVFLDGVDITKMNVLTARRRVGMLFQTPQLFDGTVGDNVRYGPSLQGKNLSEAAVEGLLAFADLDVSFAKKSVVGLSVGQAQRVALARTLANEPEVLLLDEPTSALDPISTRHIEDTVLQLKRTRGLTVIMVSHSLDQVRRLCDLVCVVIAGKLVEVLSPEELHDALDPRAKEFLDAAQQH